MTVIQFPTGGVDVAYDQPRKISVASVKAYRRLAEGHDDIVAQLDRALRIQQGGYCYLPHGLEQSVFRLVGT